MVCTRCGQVKLTELPCSNCGGRVYTNQEPLVAGGLMLWQRYAVQYKRWGFIFASEARFVGRDGCGTYVFDDLNGGFVFVRERRMISATALPFQEPPIAEEG